MTEKTKGTAESAAVAQARREMRAVARKVAPLVAELEGIAERLQKAAKTAEAVDGGKGPKDTVEAWAAELADYMAHGTDNPCGLAVTAAYIKKEAGADWRAALLRSMGHE
jgi:hypothetical protein